MKSIVLSILGTVLLSFGALAQGVNMAPVSPAQPPMASNPAQAPDKEDLTAALGYYFAMGTSNQMATRLGVNPPTDIDLPKFMELYSNVMAGLPTSMTVSQMTNILNQQAAYQRVKVVLDTEKLKATGPENKAKGIEFLKQNATAPGVVVMTNGMQYKVVKQGDGEMPTTNELVTGNFRISLIDGTEVINLHQTLPVAQPLLPAGYTEAVTNMKAGSEWILYIPYDLAYGDQTDHLGGANKVPKIGPYSTVIMDVDIESVKSRGGPLQARKPTPTSIPITVNNPSSSSARVSTSSDIVRVPSAEEIKRGSNFEVGPLEHFLKEQTNSATNAPVTK